MQLSHIPLDKLKVSALNMRHARKAPDVADILPSVRARHPAAAPRPPSCWRCRTRRCCESPACVMAETLAAGSALVEAVGNHLHVDSGRHWQPDEAFFDLLRDKAVINAMLAEVAGKAVVDANLTERVKTQKKILRDCLDGANGRARVEGWLPGWMAFPVRTYTGAGSLKIAEEWARVRDLLPAA